MGRVFFFTSPTCAPCKNVKPVINELQEDYPTLTWSFIDTTNDKENYGDIFKVTHVPTMVAVNDRNEEVGRHSGTSMMGYYSLIKKLRQSS
jgi:thiol-disulfide isomerase/thioredoxin